MRRSSVMVCLLIHIGCSAVQAVERGERERAFVRALETFDAATSPEGYRASANEFESILADGYRNGAVYYNLGNAYFRAGEFGRAILNYRKAKPYRPRDPYLSANLEQALAAAPGRLAESPRPWWIHVLFWTDWISYPTKVRAIFVGIILSAISLVTASALRRPRLNGLTVAFLLLSLAVGVDVALNHADVDGKHRAVITRETIARKGTGNSYEPAFDQSLRDGAEFTVLTETSDWTFGRFENIGDGWVRNDCVAR